MMCRNFLVFLLCNVALIPNAQAQRMEPLPQQLEGVGIEEKLNQRLPREIQFLNSEEKLVFLGQYFRGDLPVILSFYYTSCPLLCKLQLGGLVDVLKELKLDIGQDYKLLSVSLDPSETPAQAAITRQLHLQAYNREGAENGWHFLTGSEESVRELAGHVGYKYRYIPSEKEYAHPAVLMVCTPDGSVSRYLYGIDFPTQTVRLSLVEAADGKVGSTLDQVLLFCFHYDSEAGKYSVTATNIMKAGAFLTLIALGLFLTPWWLGRKGQENPRPESEGELPSASVPHPDRSHKNYSLFLLFAAEKSFWFPEPNSTVAAEIDWVFYFILALCLIFFIPIVGVMTWFVIRYRRRPSHHAEPSPREWLKLEIVWSVVPAILLVFIFFWGFTTFIVATTPPEDPYEIRVVAKQFFWTFIYPGGYTDGDLHIPEDRPIQLVMESDDVIHSLYVPAFRLKNDVIPGRYTKLYFEAPEPGTFPLFCAEYCGLQHANMKANVVVHPSGEFEKWLEDASNFLDRMSPAEAGELLYKKRGCVQCHSIDGSAKVGPTFLNLFGSENKMQDGSVLVADENYIRESILYPQKQVRQGYKPVMPTYQGQLRDEEISAIIEYIKTVK